MQSFCLKNNFHDNHFASLQVLRGLAALLIIAEHIRFLACGAFGVELFFVLSGFMILYTTHQGREGFLRKRLIRIIPFYYLMTLGTFFLILFFPSMFEQTKADPARLAKSLLFIPFDMGGGVLQPLLRIGWTINCEIFFYLLFFLAMRLSHRYRALLTSLFLVLTVGAAAVFSDFATITGAPFPQRLLQADGSVSSLAAPLLFYGSPVMLEFILGMICYYAARAFYQQVRQKSRAGLSGGRLTGSLSLAAGCLLLVFLTLTARQTNILGIRRLLYWGLPAMLAVLAFFAAGLFLKMPSPLVKLGNISFSVYLIHYYPIMLLDRKVFDFSTLCPMSVLGAVVGTILVLACSALAFYVIEKRFTGWLRRRLL